MFSTLYLILLVAFQLWYLTSRQLKTAPSAAYLQPVIRNQRQTRLMGGVLCLAATALFIAKLGWMSGISASIIGLMGIGCLTVTLQPFNYLRIETVVLLYVFSLILELLV